MSTTEFEPTVFLSDEIPDDWEKIVEREKTIREQHRYDIEAAYRRSFETGTLSKNLPVRTLMSTLLPNVIKYIETFCNSIKTDPKARHNKSLLLRLASEDYQSYAYIAMMTMIDESTKQQTIAHVLANIGKLCEEEAQVAHWKKHAKKFFTFVMDRQRKNTTDREWIKKGLSVAMGRYIRGEYKLKNGKEGGPHPEVMFDDWPKKYKEFVAKTLYEAVMTTTPLFEILVRRYSANNRAVDNANKLAPSVELLKWIGDANARLGTHNGFYLPLPVPPRHWTSTHDGGYWTSYGGQLNLVKNTSPAYQEEILERSEDFAITFKAVNAAQDTAWRINVRVMNVLRDLIHEGKEIAGLPPADEKPLPVCPKCKHVIMPGEDHECFRDKAVLKEWKEQAHETYKANVTARSRRLRLGLSEETAELLSGDERFYYVYQTDFRGRLYPTGVFTPQGTDAEKAMLEFADGVPLGEHGAKWLAVHTANCWGEDKSDYDVRVKWTRDNTSWILQCADEPLVYREWTEADSPFMFLAACMEWAQYVREGDSFKSHIPIGLDGSCSGIQHYSALLRDEVGALATNVKATPGQKRKSDIYQMVADKALEQFREDLTNEDQNKAKWALFILAHNAMNRKITKRAVMTLPYGSTFQSCKEYVGEALKERAEVKALHNDEKTALCNYAAKVVWDSIPKVVKGAREGMNYLKMIARLVCKSATPVTWQTPTGFIVHQTYYLPDVHIIKTIMNGNIAVKVSMVADSKHIDKGRQVNGIAPNFIHSLDASHLMFSVCAAKDRGINYFALVHDSLGTHAGNTEEFFYLLRQQFYELYKNHQPLHTFVSNVMPLILPDDKDKIKDPPIIGTLRLEDILDAKFLFS